MANPATHDFGVWVDDTVQRGDSTSSSWLWSQDHIALSDGTLLFATPGTPATGTDNLYFYYSTDQGETWTVCSTFLVPNNGGTVSYWFMAADGNDNIYVTSQAGGLEKLSRMTFSGTDMALVGTSNGPVNIGPFFLVDDPGTGSAYDVLMYILPPDTTTGYVYGWSSGNAFSVTSFTIPRMADPRLFSETYGNPNNRMYGGADDVVYFTGVHTAGGAHIVLGTLSHTSGTSFAVSSQLKTPTGLTVDPGSAMCEAFYNHETSEANFMVWDESANDWNFCNITLANWLTGTPTNNTVQAEHGSYSASTVRNLGVYVESAQKVLIGYIYGGGTPRRLVWQWYDITGDSWDGTWNVENFSNTPVRMGAFANATDESGAYIAAFGFSIIDDSAEYYPLFYALEVGAGAAGAASGWGWWG